MEDNLEKIVNQLVSNNFHLLNFFKFSDKFQKWNINIDSLSKILNIKNLFDLTEAYYQSTGLGIAIYDENNVLLSSVGWQKICTHFHQKHPGAQISCFESEKYFKNHFEADQTIAFKCKNGLWDSAFPIYYKGKFIGSINFGQFFLFEDKIEKEFFIKQAEMFNFDTEVYIEHLRNVPIFSIEKIQVNIILFLTILVEQIKQPVDEEIS